MITTRLQKATQHRVFFPFPRGNSKIDETLGPFQLSFDLIAIREIIELEEQRTTAKKHKTTAAEETHNTIKIKIPA